MGTTVQSCCAGITWGSMNSCEFLLTLRAEWMISNTWKALLSRVTVYLSYRTPTCRWNIPVHRDRSFQILMALSLRVFMEERSPFKYWKWLWLWEDSLKSNRGHDLRLEFIHSRPAKHTFKGRDSVFVCRGHSSKANGKTLGHFNQLDRWILANEFFKSLIQSFYLIVV